ncbi:ABC transporter permease [Rhodococcus sp. NPDC057014]|uniref:ABC transporter permease n=1 Tax=unclassified Rhodococcus (in: high G+C Gram-positive bacteria) TaxID=192944 RepID=UPI003625B913
MIDETGVETTSSPTPQPHSRRRLRRRGRTWPLFIPAAVVLVVFFAYPTATMLLAAFTDFRAPQVAGADNFLWFFQTDANVTILIRTLMTAFICTLVTTLLAYPYAYTMTLVSATTRTLMIAAVLISMFAGILLRNFAWIVLLQQNGLVNSSLAAVGIPPQTFLGTPTAVMIGMTHVLFPYMVLPLYAVLRGIDRRLILAAQSLGATPLRAFYQVYVPLSVPGISAGAVLVFVLGLGFFITPALLGSPQQAMLSQLMVLQFDRMAAFGRAGAMAVVLLVITLLVLAIVQVATRRRKGQEQ